VQARAVAVAVEAVVCTHSVITSSMKYAQSSWLVSVLKAVALS
jgi:hypothetical protein